jgi:predicted nucleotide-binding protein
MNRESKEKAIERITKVISQIDEMKAMGRKAPEYKKWKRDVEICLEYIFGPESRHIKDFTKIRFSLMAYGPNTPDSAFEDAFQRGMDNAKVVLQSMIEEIQEYWVAKEQVATAIAIGDEIESMANEVGRDVFIIHGHDNGIKETVARFLSQLKLNPIILHEQANEGRTIIEKFEQFSAVPYAIALFTPDDVGGTAIDPKLTPRARQNVIFEFGYFIGKLGRKNVCGLFKKGVEIPSDYSGVLYIPIDDDGYWKMLLVKEMKAAGFDIDANLVL